MALAPVKIKWSQQIETTLDESFVVETTALAHTYFVQNPVLMFHNIGTEDADLEIVYTLTLNSQTDDPLHSGTYTETVVSVTVPGGERYAFDFAGQHLDNNADYSITHTVTITNNGVTTNTYHTILTGVTEVQTQFASASSVLTNVS